MTKSRRFQTYPQLLRAADRGLLPVSSVTRNHLEMASRRVRVIGDQKPHAVIDYTDGIAHLSQDRRQIYVLFSSDVEGKEGVLTLLAIGDDLEPWGLDSFRGFVVYLLALVQPGQSGTRHTGIRRDPSTVPWPAGLSPTGEARVI